MPYRVSVQWRVRRVEIMERLKMAWVASRVMNLSAKNMASLLDDMHGLLGQRLVLPSGASQLQTAQAIVDAARSERRDFASIFEWFSLFLQNLKEEGTGSNSHFANASHNDQLIRAAAWEETVSVRRNKSAKQGTATIYLGPVP